MTLPDEGRYVGVALEMLRSGDWLVPTLDGLPFFHKPPLFYWLTAASLDVGGTHLLASRAAPLLSSFAMLGFIAWFASRRLGPHVAAWTVLMLSTMPFFVGASQFANLDLLVAACITGAIVFMADSLLNDPRARNARHTMAAGWLMVALGVLAKGLIGIVLPLAVVGAWSLQRRVSLRHWLDDVRRAFVGIGPLLALGIALPWFLMVERRHPGFLHYFIVEQPLQRYTSTGFNNPQPFWFFAPVIAGLTLPWFLFVGRGPACDEGRAERTLAGWWIGVTVLFFSWPRSKLAGYVLPVLPPLALLLASRALQVREAWLHDGRRRLGLLAAAAAACVGRAATTGWWQSGRNHQAIAEVLDHMAPPGEPVFALDIQPYDLAFHSRVARPTLLVSAWDSASLDRHDDWRKELADAARFAPEHAAEVLLSRDQAMRRWCSQAASWVIAPHDAQAREPALYGVKPLALTKRDGLWRLDRRHLRTQGLCAEPFERPVAGQEGEASRPGRGSGDATAPR
ncbi:MAG TPA: glycosyltransferase family 39 protein [Burkholderiaceae bacterium]|nr:glycosyltransferase family 39 protein [Burkholderiaceae bacterium]